MSPVKIHNPAFARAHAAYESGAPFVLLCSGMRTSYSGAASYLATQPDEIVTGEDIAAFEKKIKQAGEARWYGYFGYELHRALEKTDTPAPPASFAMPPLWMARFTRCERFEGSENTMRHSSPRLLGEVGRGEVENAVLSDASTLTLPRMQGRGFSLESLRSNMTKAEYLAKVAHTLERIRAGDFYQANLTRKFYGEFARAPDPFALFTRLCHISPAPYSAMIYTGDAYILSSSPELFLRIEHGEIVTRPIKGSLGPGQDREALLASVKDRAENLMIVDLMRNDLSRICIPGSVTVDALCEVDSFATIHHMASTVRGRMRPDASPLDGVAACFPPGSMTGAPKLAAMRWCEVMEGATRGVYSGALGWIGPDAAELSVTIRTLLLRGNRFEFQVGGGIVADSDPLAEWVETLDKAAGMAQALGITREELERL